MSESRNGGPWSWLVPRLAMIAGVLAWLWPIGLGGQMPFGGDSTQFSMGLMAFLGDSIRLRRLPIWNDHWGFGFPGLAESQMGVFYPPHLILYGTLPTEIASTLSLVLHTLWGALGANWASRRFGSSEVGSALAGFAWATCGFFLIHLPHQWGYTVGSWMPWAWALAWQVSRGRGSKRTPWLLSAVLAIQILPGHFQLAFVTEVSTLALVMVGSGRSIGRRLAVLLAILGMIPLSAMQLWPTFQLARLSDAHRDFEYLSGFASTPIHLVNSVAPGLFHRSPLWRPVVWDPFHTSPEELLGYVGLVPLFLALASIFRGVRGDVGVRSLAIVAALTLFLGFGPYAPGFDWLIRLPGFSFFRAPARWGLATSLALAILAGRGFHAWQSWPNLGRSLRRFVVGSLVAVLVVVLGFEMAMASSKGHEWSMVASTFDRALKILPWSDRPESKSFRGVMAEARKPQEDVRTQTAMARLGIKPGSTLEGDRLAIYRRELVETGALLVALLLVSSLARNRPLAFSTALIALTIADGMILARHRPFDLGPARPLIDQSPVLARIAREPRGTRTLDPAQNLFLVVNASPVSAYRTLDLPSPGGLLQVARGSGADARVAQAIRASGVGIRVIGPLKSQGLGPGGELIRDPTLAGWLIGVDLVASTGLENFAVIPAGIEPNRAWILPAEGLATADGMTDPFVLIDRFQGAGPLLTTSNAPEHEVVQVKGDRPVASMVVLSKTFDPEWQAWWISSSGDRRPGEVIRVLGGWQGVAVPGPGDWTLHLNYRGRAVWVGLTISALAWVVWLVVYLRLMMIRISQVPEA